MIKSNNDNLELPHNNKLPINHAYRYIDMFMSIANTSAQHWHTHNTQLNSNSKCA